MGLFDASSRSSSTDSRQAAGDSSQQQHGHGNKLIQGGTDLSNSKFNTGTQIKGSKISTTNKINVTGADPADLTLLASQAINQLGQNQSSSNSLLSSLASAVTSGTGSGSSSQPSGLTQLVNGALSDAGLGAPPSSSGSAGASSTGVKGWWAGLSLGAKLLVAGGALLLLSGLIYFFKRL